MNRAGTFSIALAALIIHAPLVLAQASANGKPATAQAAAPAMTSSKEPFDPHDLSGIWMIPAGVPRSQLLFRSSQPEPPLTVWGRQHMFDGGITHGLHPVPSGHFAGENCNPIAAPAQFAYMRFYPFEIIQMPGRIHQDFELHREWRDIWIGQEHPKDIYPTYMGNSVAQWDGNTLVVDTTGYNGKDWVTEDVAHPMSDQFHLVERYTRLNHDTLKIEMTFYDPKNWGDKSWGGFSRTLRLQHEPLQEWICVPEIDAEFNEKIMKPVYGSKHLELPQSDTNKQPKQ